MTSRHQQDAISAGLFLVQKLPDDVAYGLTCTNDDSVLNIFAPESRWREIRATLALGEPADRSIESDGEQFLSFKIGALLVSIIEEDR